MVKYLTYWIRVRSFLGWLVSLSILASIFIILPYLGNIESIDMKISPAIELFLNNSLLLDHLYPSEILGDRKIITSIFLYTYIILALLLFLSTILKPLGVIIRGLLLSFSIHLYWTYSTGKVILFKFGDLLSVERKLTIEQKIELFNKTIMEIKPKINIVFNDIAADLAGVNDPLQAELLIKNYIYKINTLVAEQSQYIASTGDLTPWIKGGVIFIGGCLVIGILFYLTKGGVSTTDVATSISDERNNIMNPIKATNDELEKIETVIKTAGDIHKSDAIINQGLRDLSVNTKERIDAIGQDLEVINEELIEQVKNVMLDNNDIIFDTMEKVTKQTNANLATKDWVKDYIKEYLKTKIT